jgi:hypothetical protein
LKDLGENEVKIRKAYNLLLEAVGANSVGRYFGDLAIAQKVIYICGAGSFFIS